MESRYQLIFLKYFFCVIKQSVPDKKTTFKKCGSHPLKSFLLMSYYTGKYFFNLVGNVLGVPLETPKIDSTHGPKKISLIGRSNTF